MICKKSFFTQQIMSSVDRSVLRLAHSVQEVLRIVLIALLKKGMLSPTEESAVPELRRALQALDGSFERSLDLHLETYRRALRYAGLHVDDADRLGLVFPSRDDLKRTAVMLDHVRWMLQIQREEEAAAHAAFPSLQAPPQVGCFEAILVFFGLRR